MCTQRKGHMSSAQLFASQERGKPHRKPAQLAPSSQTSSLPSSVGINFGSLSRPAWMMSQHLLQTREEAFLPVTQGSTDDSGITLALT